MSTKRWGSVLLAAAVGTSLACGTDVVAPGPTSLAEAKTLVDSVRLLTAGRGITGLGKPARVRPELVQLGRVLAFDKELSGNRDISCMTCHLPQFATGDGRSLSIGQGGTGLGTARVPPGGAFIPRNAPALFNLFALGPLFWDGRVSVDTGGRYHTPAGDQLTPAMTAAFEFGALSAQPMFPVLSRAEMRGDGNSNELAAIDDAQTQQIWSAIMERLGRIQEYRRLFAAAYPTKRFEDLNFAYAANAIAGFLTQELAFNDSPWDQFLRGNDNALTPTALAGARDFMSAKCSICHNGPAFTDNKFHNVALAQLGPGEGDGAGGSDDFGRMRVTGNAADRYLFRTPPLRNVELTSPYGHDGAFPDLRAFVDHYSVSDVKLHTFSGSPLEPALQGTVLQDFDAVLATRDTLLKGVVFQPQTVDEVTAFMKALTDPRARDLSFLVPARVPSGLPVDGN
jgi:cytochrome c peroxidase